MQTVPLMADEDEDSSARVDSTSKGLKAPEVLWIEDDDEFRAFGALAFRNSGVRLRSLASLAEARQVMDQLNPDLFLLDAHLPDGSGVDFCREIRSSQKFARAAVAVFTGQRKVWDSDRWFDAGADQCWIKTSNARRLVALVKGLLRRKASVEDRVRTPLGGLSIDPIRRTVSYNGQRSRRLSQRELVLFDLLFKRAPDVLTREYAHSEVRGFRGAEDPDLALNTLVSRLRHKLPEPVAAGVIVVRGLGYALKLPLAGPDR